MYLGNRGFCHVDTINGGGFCTAEKLVELIIDKHGVDIRQINMDFELITNKKGTWTFCFKSVPKLFNLRAYYFAFSALDGNVVYKIVFNYLEHNQIVFDDFESAISHIE